MTTSNSNTGTTSNNTAPSLQTAVSQAVSGTLAANTAPSLQTAVSQAVSGTLAAPLEAVILLLRAADKVSDTVYGDIKRAAHLAAAVMSPGLDPEEKKDQVLAVYAQLWLEIKDDNIKRDFTNLLWIYADPKAQVRVPKPVKSGEAPQTQIVDAIKTLNGMSKKTITDVSKQIRDIHDCGRASGAGRPKKVVAPQLPANPLPNTGTSPVVPTLVAPPVTTTTPPMNTSGVVPPVTPPVTPLLTPSANPAVSTGTLQPGATSTTTTPATLPAPSKPPAAQPAKATVTSKISVEEQDAAFYGELKVRLAIPGDAAKIHAAVEAGGYTVRRKANVTPAKTETPKDKTTILAEQLLNTTPETAIQQAAKKAAEAKLQQAAKS